MRVTSSVLSLRSFCSSTRPSVAVRVASRRTGSAQLAGGRATATDIPHPLCPVVIGQPGAGVATEDVLERGVGSDVGAQRVRGADGLQTPVVHERNGVAQLVGLLHVVRG